MKTKFTILILFSIFQITFAQEDLNSALRIGIGSQRNFYSEIGYQYKIGEKVKPGCAYSYSPSAFYSTIEWTTKSDSFKDVYAVKVGYEQMLSLPLSYAIEAKYQTNFDSKDFVVTPKVGLYASEKFSLFYSYNISTNGNPFGNVGQHQFSLIFNLNKDAFSKEKTGEPNKSNDEKQ